jgi:hypothetical protein
VLIRQDTLERIRDGSVTLQFRRWSRPTVKEGGTLMTSIGVLAIESITQVEVEALTDAEARAAGFDGLDALVEALDASKRGGQLHRVEVSFAGADPRIALREQAPDPEEVEAIRKKLERWDRASPVGPWTVVTLDVIAARPELRAGDLADEVEMERARFKTNVRKLKGLGLTESLKVGYRLSPRGEALRRLL